MNKYQEALSSILFTLHLRVKPKILGNCEDENLEVLQELVDRATPKKPIYESKLSRYGYRCPICELFVDDDFCKNCGQAIDWSESTTGSAHNELDNIFADDLEMLERLKIKK